MNIIELLKAHVARFFDLSNPTAPANYHDDPMPGMPLYWRNDASGRMATAVMSFLEGMASEEELGLVIAYVQHYIHAPVWTANPAGAFNEPIEELRRQSLELKTPHDIDKFINGCLECALDPF